MSDKTETPARGVCPYCGLDAGTGPWSHPNREGCIRALKERFQFELTQLREKLERADEWRKVSEYEYAELERELAGWREVAALLRQSVEGIDDYPTQEKAAEAYDALAKLSEKP